MSKLGTSRLGTGVASLEQGLQCGPWRQYGLSPPLWLRKLMFKHAVFVRTTRCVQHQGPMFDSNSISSHSNLGFLLRYGWPVPFAMDAVLDLRPWVLALSDSSAGQAQVAEGPAVR